jgi:nicotinamidase/pyrazinamidase
VKTLIVVDLQRDFVPGGALAVPEGDRVLEVVNRILPAFALALLTKDWHPADHGSFVTSHPGRSVGDVVLLEGLDQVLWPPHCVQGTPGADFVPGLDVSAFARVFPKGVDRGVDSYSGFFDNGHRHATGLEAYLKGAGVRRIHLAGLATDYCVWWTARDALALGFEVAVIEDACRGVNLKRGDVESAVGAMRKAGVSVLSSEECR